MKRMKSFVPLPRIPLPARVILSIGLAFSTPVLSVDGGSTTPSPRPLPLITVGPDNNSTSNAVVQPTDPIQAGGGIDQSLQCSDVLNGLIVDDFMNGRLGGDLITGGGGHDILLGGPEHNNPLNRDRLFGNNGNDLFLWSPGDGSDFMNGGPGKDIVMVGLLGEYNGDGQLVFENWNDGRAGDLAVDSSTNLPMMDIDDSPTYCEVVDQAASPMYADELEALGLTHLVLVYDRAVADSFAAGLQGDDNGLRATLHIREVEFLLCGSRQGGLMDVLDLTLSPPGFWNPRRLPDRVDMILE